MVGVCVVWGGGGISCLCSCACGGLGSLGDVLVPVVPWGLPQAGPSQLQPQAWRRFVWFLVMSVGRGCS